MSPPALLEGSRPSGAGADPRREAPRALRHGHRPDKRALKAGVPIILEASFLKDHIFVAVDALSREGDYWILTEFKATTRVKPEHIPDAAIQAHVLQQVGLPVGRVELMHLNTEHRHPDVGPLFIRADITQAVAGLRPRIAGQIEQQRQMLQGPVPDVETGPHCKAPRVCPFLNRCHGPRPAYAIDELNSINASQLGELRDAGIETIDQIPSDFPLTALHGRQRNAVRESRMIVEPGLASALERYSYPIAMLDFETVNPALPVWKGCTPFAFVPVQFSVHTLHPAGGVTHHAYLADARTDPRPGFAEERVESPSDPRPRLAAELTAALRNAATILAWNAQFERQCLQSLAESSPEHAPALLRARDKLQDLLPLVKSHLYHPAFHGSFTIKSVVQALLPDLAYADLEVVDGETASRQLETLLCRPEELTPTDRQALRRRLVAYCTRDTEVMVALFRFLLDRAKPTAPI